MRLLLRLEYEQKSCPILDDYLFPTPLVMTTIRILPNGKYRTDIRKRNVFIQPKTFNTKQQAEQYACEIESKIDSILSIKPKKIKKLLPAKVEGWCVLLTVHEHRIRNPLLNRPDMIR